MKENLLHEYPEKYVMIPREPIVCPVCNFRTKINGVLQHDRKCNMRDVHIDRAPVSDALRNAAWTIFPSADVPYTEIYRAMLAAARKGRK